MSGRPEALFGLFSSLETLDGVGPKTAANFAGLGVYAPRDLLFTLPINVLDRQHRDSIEGLRCPTMATVTITIGAHRSPRTKGAAYRIAVSDAETSFQLVFFHARGDYLARILPQGSRHVVSGKLELFDGLYQMVHPDYMVPESEIDTIPAFEPVYPLTSGITQKLMFKATRAALKMVPEMVEWIDPGQMRKTEWPDVKKALSLAHRPQNSGDITITAAARERLAYDEMLAHQLTLALARLTERQKKGRATHGNGALQDGLIASLPYPLTDAQKRAVSDVNGDMGEAVRMNRLLQGDVGAGKTLVAFLALLRAVEAGGQGVLMAPTEILARQHLQSLKPMADQVGVRLEILTGRDTGRERAAKLDDLSNGNIGILVGTHAVFQKGVTFSDLRLAVIDEQHRFGVEQRLALGQKGVAVDVLVMTATPIPRSLALAQYGDMEVSILDEKPPGRMPIKTALVSVERMEEVVSRLRAAVEGGRQCYWVCPLVEESEVVDLTAAEDRFKQLRTAFGEGMVGLVHGQMPAAEKDAAMARFESGQTKVLVATTVIEVGVNVPNATIMVIERAEIFGLAQLHQLRGRVGRGEAASTCLLMYQPPLSKSGQHRLEVLRETEDGFVIAETDLKMRGAGDVIGTAQSGLPRFWIADLERQAGLMEIAQSDARKLLADDPRLMAPRGQAARMLLWLLRKEESIRLISVG